MRHLARVSFVAFTLFAGAACSSSGEATPPSHEVVGTQRSASSGLTRKLWILNQNGAPYVGEFFQCVLGANSNWNAIANTYSAGESLDFGGQVQRNDNPCTANVNTPSFYQCAVNAGKFDVQPWDVVLVIIPDSGYGGQNGTASVVNPVTHATVTINSAYVRTSPDPIYQTIYGGHEVFEAQTDGVSADCCDGETSSGGPFPWCAQCGPYNNGAGVCGKYATGGQVGTLGIDTIHCPSGTYKYQRVSPANHEFDGTCLAIVPSVGADPCANVSSANNGWYCGKSNQNGFGGGSSTTLYDCQDGYVAKTQACPLGCFVAGAGQADGCNTAVDAGSDASAHGGADGGKDAETDASPPVPPGPTGPTGPTDDAGGAGNGASPSPDTSGQAAAASGGCAVASRDDARVPWVLWAPIAALAIRLGRRRTFGKTSRRQ